MSYLTTAEEDRYNRIQVFKREIAEQEFEKQKCVLLGNQLTEAIVVAQKYIINLQALLYTVKE
jgi:hypothetical protein